MEQFSIPGAGGIIVKEINYEKNILIQTRIKPNAPCEDGLLEIPAGKIRAFESIFNTLKREIKEETGLDVVEILGENLSMDADFKTKKNINGFTSVFLPNAHRYSQKVRSSLPVAKVISSLPSQTNPVSSPSADHAATLTVREVPL